MRYVIFVFATCLSLTSAADSAEKPTFEVSGVSRTSHGDAERRADYTANKICHENEKTEALRIGEFKYSHAEGKIECDVRGVCRRRITFFAVGRYACSDRAITSDEIDSCSPPERLCRTAWGSIPYCSASCDL